jgi:hypothetical protein
MNLGGNGSGTPSITLRIRGGRSDNIGSLCRFCWSYVAGQMTPCEARFDEREWHICVSFAAAVWPPQGPSVGCRTETERKGPHSLSINSV